METLDLSNSPAQSEGRLKALFWPSIQNGSDVDYLGARGYWICAIVAVFSCFVLAATGQPVIAAAAFLFYYLGGVGVREHSRYAAAAVFLMYFLDSLLAPGILRIILTGALLSNLRATWIAAKWKPESEEAILPPRMDETLADKLADKFPSWLWPKVRIVYYIFSAVFSLLVVAGLFISVAGVMKK
jgi:hypothetical protein